jgi:hypothetical protein
MKGIGLFKNKRIVQVTIRTGGSSELSRYMAMISSFTGSITEDITTNCTVDNIFKVYLARGSTSNVSIRGRW